jgi:hypothetical protein
VTHLLVPSIITQVFDELSCSEVPVINPHIPVLVRFMLEVAANRQFDGLVRERAKNLVVVIIQVRSAHAFRDDHLS